MNGRPTKLYGILAEFRSPEALLAAARAAREAGYRRMDAFSPFPVEGLAEQVGFGFNLLPWLVLLAGFGGAALGFYMEYYGMAISYPIVVAGRPLNSWPAYIPITFELGVLSASIVGLLGMLMLSGLPRPSHPVFYASRFSLATRDRFFLCIEAADPLFNADEARAFLEGQSPEGVEPVETR